MNGLALQGGGCLGYGQALIMTQAERRWGKPTSKVFQLIGGTSVGSIIGAGLAAGIPAVDLQTFFTQEAPVIFDSSVWGNISSLWGPKYSADPLEKSLQKVFGTRTLSDCTTNFMATAYDWATDRLVYFKTFEASSINEDYIVIGPDSGIRLWEVCRASSAAQTYFPAYKYNSLVLMDGGNTGDNAPDMLVLSEMINNTTLDKCRMLSLGAGNTTWKANPNSMVNPSKIRAGLETIQIVFSAGEDSQVYKAKHILKDNYTRLAPNLGNGIAIDDAAGCIKKIPAAVHQLLNSDPSVNAELDDFNN